MAFVAALLPPLDPVAAPTADAFVAARLVVAPALADPLPPDPVAFVDAVVAEPPVAPAAALPVAALPVAWGAACAAGWFNPGARGGAGRSLLTVVTGAD